MRPNCVIHKDRPATYTAQGIAVDDECYQRYREEYLAGQRSNNLTLRSRPFLQQLIRASTEANFPEDKVLTTGGGGAKVAAHAKEEATQVQAPNLSA